ncbi:20036_t:CDS:2 [Funneliformis geosporum]|uniref:4105_t:CDS:1 n=1 Tax=Funneliformis geosporum TaxID=1117311 RepID=A0A9W4X4K5_9GLOM|nr:20036_t:CDS:2 [Funneliformis geosporum]CAI2186113.1 4105_t:CDS:2 [Funneliformis geosporum]
MSIFNKASASALSKTTRNIIARSNGLKKGLNTRVALYTSLFSGYDPFGSQNVSSETKSSATFQDNDVVSPTSDPFSAPQDAFSGNSYESARQYKRTKFVEPDYIDLTQGASNSKDYSKNFGNFPSAQPHPSYKNNNFISSKSSQPREEFTKDKIRSFDKPNLSENAIIPGQTPILLENQKIIDAIDEHGENWEQISKEVYNHEINPDELERIWAKISNFKIKSNKLPSSQSSKSSVYPFWTTKECFKLIDAVKVYGEDWQKISVECFQGVRSSFSLEKKWEKMWFPNEKNVPNQWNREDVEKLKHAVNQHGENWELISRDVFNGYKKKNGLLWKWNLIKDQNQGDITKKERPLKSTQGIMDKDQLARKLGRNLNLHCSSLVELFGQRAISIETYFNESSGFPWTVEENTTLFGAIKEFGTKNWEKISERLPGKSLKNIQERCSSTLWEPREVEAFDKAYELHGIDWNKISGLVGTRTPGQCWSYWRITTGNDLLKSHSGNRKPGFYHANIFVQFSNKETSQMSFIRHNIEGDFSPE